LWQQQEKPEAVRQLLTEMYGWFTEGFDTADLCAARTLLSAAHSNCPASLAGFFLTSQARM
jgi:hypothetical protein